MRIHDIEHLETLSDAQLWKVANDRHNHVSIRQAAIRRWLFPEETDIDAEPDNMAGARLGEILARATVLESDEINENDTRDAGEMAPYFDSQGRLILQHDNVSYLLQSMAGEGSYDGISTKDELYATDDKTNMDTNL